MLEGDWEAAEKRAAAGPDEEAPSDDEVFGDFEDMEAGKHHACHISAVLQDLYWAVPCKWYRKRNAACDVVL